MAAYSVGQHRDTDTGRLRWGVYQAPAGVWYFPARYGRAAAVAMARRLSAYCSAEG